MTNMEKHVIRGQRGRSTERRLAGLAGAVVLGLSGRGSGAQPTPAKKEHAAAPTAEEPSAEEPPATQTLAATRPPRHGRVPLVLWGGQGGGCPELVPGTV